MNYDLVLGGFIGIAATFISLVYYKNSSKQRNGNLLIRVLVIISILLVLFSFIAPILFSQVDKLGIFDFSSETGAVGDTIGGIMNPFIALTAVMVTGLAFYMQYQANKQVQDQFKLQQFESQLYKMIDNYNNTINSYKIKSRESEEVFEGKDYFFSLHQEYKSVYLDIESFIKNYFERKNMPVDYKKVILDDYLKKINDIALGIEELVKLELAYIIVFYGVSQSGREAIQNLLEDKYDNILIQELTNYLSYKLRGFEKNDDGNSYWEDKRFQLQKTDWSMPNESNKLKYHNGHQSKLGHYFRQNYMIIKAIDDFKSDQINYDKRWEYSKLLRSLYSNHEQIIFFLNSISLFGRDWELNKKNDKNKQWITKYDLIRNIPKNYRKRYYVSNIYPNVHYEFDDESIERIELNEKVYY